MAPAAGPDCGYRAWLGGVELVELACIDATSLSALVPPNLAPGTHALVVESPFRTRAGLKAAFAVLPGRGPVLKASGSVSRAQVSVGQRAEVTLTVENSGTVDVREVAPSLSVGADAGCVEVLSGDPATRDVPAGESAHFTWTFVGATSGEVRFSLQASGIDPQTSGALQMPPQDVAVTIQTPPALVATASLAPSTATVGQEVAVTALVRNDGLATVLGVDAEVASSFSGLGPPAGPPEPQDIRGGESATFRWTYRPTAPTPEGGTPISVTAGGTDANTGSAVTAPATTNVLLVNEPAEVGANLLAPAQVTAGQQITVTLEVENTGFAPADVTPVLDEPAASGAVTLSPSKGAALDTVRIAPWSKDRFSWTFVVSGSGTLTFGARAAWRDVNGGQEGSAPTAPVTVRVMRPASLVLRSVSATPAVLVVGQPLTVTAVAANDGEAAALSVVPTISPAPAGFAMASGPAAQDVPGGGRDRTFTWTYSVEAPAAGGAFAVSLAGVDENTGAAVTAVQATTNHVVVAHPIGGAVAGLAGSGLVLRSGGESLSLSPGASTFTFRTPVASGSGYGVTVETQPVGPTQVCEVANATGTVGSVPVTTVEVSCSTRSFQVGGTVAGLAGEGLVLRSGADTLEVKPGATDFVFPTPLPSGTTFEVSVAAQPAAPAQACAVTHGSGTVGSATVTVAVACTTRTFPVGGTVAGLVGTIVLRNGGDAVLVEADGSFMFPTPVASGAPYAVTVGSHPAGPSQACEVANGSGTVVASDVTTVAVTCTTNSYLLGGSVSGLVGSIVLRNGGEDLAVIADGPFRFATAIESGARYEVTVAGHPTGPSQGCAVTNATGTIHAADVSTVVVTCATDEYVVGGAIAGLRGAGLVLANGVETISIESGATLFTLPRPIESGMTYDVRVVSQPTGPAQSCTVADGAGTVVDAEVTGIHVTCATRAFSIGGTVTGLLGRGLVLRNGGDSIGVEPGATDFAFPSPVASGDFYAVTIEVQPTDPHQTCVIADEAGIVESAAITVSVTCKTMVVAADWSGGTPTETSTDACDAPGHAAVLDDRGATRIGYDATTGGGECAGVVQSGRWDFAASERFALEIGWDKGEVRAQVEVYLRFADDHDANYAVWKYWPAATHPAGQTLVIPKSAFTIVGIPRWSEVEQIEVRLRRMSDSIRGVTAGAGENAVYIYRFWSHVAARPKVLITFDDAATTAYTEAFRRMHAAGMRGTIYVNGITVTTQASGHASLAQLKEMDAAGWDIANHTYSHLLLAKRITSYTRSGTTATMTFATAHGYASGDAITIAGCDSDEFSGVRTVTVTSPTTITFVTPGLEADTVARGNCYIVDSVDPALVRSDLRRSRDWLLANGFERGVNHLAYPWGAWDLSLVRMLRDEFGVLTARGVGNINAGSWTLPVPAGIGAPHVLPAYLLNSAATAAKTLDQVDRAITEGATIIFYGHQLFAEPSLEMLISEFQAFIDGLAARRDAGLVDVVTISEWFEQVGLAGGASGAGYATQEP